MKNKLLTIGGIVACMVFFPIIAGATGTSTGKAEVLESITEEELKGYVQEITHEKYKGRVAGSPEYMDVAAYVAGLLEQWDIEPLGDDGTYFQNFPWPYTEVLSVGSFSLFMGDEKISYSAPADYYPGASSDNGSVKAEVVFAGYGISAPELGYDDYNDIDITGKIVMIASGTPYIGKNADTLNLWGVYSGSVYKVENAHRKGAAGVLFLDKLANPSIPHFRDFHLVHVDKHVSEKILGIPADTLLTGIRQTKTSNSFLTDFEAEITSETVHHGEGRTANVIGYIPGTDPELAKEAIILGAHLDAQGYLGFELPGALDNASGVADVLAAARALSEFKGKMKRSVVFLFFGAEEVGLVGSTFYCEHPAFNQENTLLFMNLDMVGNGSGLALWHGESYPELFAHFSRNNEQFLNRSLRSSKGSMPVGRPRTDGLVFMLYGFRTLHVGAIDRVNPLYYHDPRDVAANLTYDIMRDVSRLMFLGVLDMANDDTIRADQLFLIQE
ncbi:MAG: M28 family peptidase [Bacteroidota bacterium]